MREITDGVLYSVLKSTVQKRTLLTSWKNYEDNKSFRRQITSGNPERAWYVSLEKKKIKREYVGSFKILPRKENCFFTLPTVDRRAMDSN